MRRLTGLLLLLQLLARPAAAQDAFERQRADALARMTDVDPIYLTFAEGRSTYRLGESIPLTVEFSPIGLRSVMGGGCSESDFIASVDNSDAVVDPRHVAWRDPRDSWLGGGGCGDEYTADALQFAGPAFPPLGPEFDRPIITLLVREHIDLTALVRFAQPGRYRFYLRTGFEAPIDRTPPRLSNVLTIDLLPRDPTWEAEVLASARHALRSGDALARRRAMSAVRRLGTNDAVDLVLALPDTPLEDIAWSARDRVHVVRRLTEQLDDVTRQVDWRFIWTLAALDATMRGTAPVPREAVEARLRAHSVRRLRALEAHGQLDSALGAAMFHAARGFGDRVMWQVPAAGFSAVADAVSRALLALPPREQRVVLADALGWRDFADPAFLPMFKRIAQDRRPGGAQDVAWAMWHRLEPDAARAFALREIAAPGAVLGTSGLPGLGDRLRPSLDAPLVARLEAAMTDAEFLRAASLIERFSTGRLRSRVARVFERAPRASVCPQGPVLLAYFFRVDPAYAETQLDRIGRVLDTTRAMRG